jgi:hypothetical protein
MHATRWFGVAPEQQLPALLAASREAQGRVTKALADQVLEARHLLLAGFENAATGGADSALAAAYRDPELGPDHVGMPRTPSAGCARSATWCSARSSRPPKTRSARPSGSAAAIW